MASHRTPAFRTYEEDADTDIDSNEEEEDSADDTIPRIILFHPNCRCVLFRLPPLKPLETVEFKADSYLSRFRYTS
jgi:hypothetical protein